MANLRRARRGKDCAGNTGAQQAWADERGKRGFVAGAAAGEEGDWRGRGAGLDGGWFEVDCLVGEVAGDGRVGVRDAEEGGGDEVGGVVDEVF